MMLLFSKRKKHLIGAGLALILVILLILIGSITQGENIAYFYPETCLGNWQNPEKAAGKKEIDDNYNELNSAFFDGGLREIYCGNFKGEIPKGEINSVNLKIDWLWSNTKINYIPIETEENNQLNSFLQEIVPAKEVILIFEESTSTQSEPTPSFNTQESLPNNQNLPLETIESPTSTFYLPKLFNYVFAQEENQLNITSTSTETTILSEYTTSAEINTSSETNLIQTITQNNPEKIFQIFYTLNGTDWLYLTDVNNSNWQNFSINIPVNDWLDIEKVQIKIASLPILGNYPYVYLKNFKLEVNYEMDENLESIIFFENNLLKTYCGNQNDENLKNVFLKFLLTENEEIKNIANDNFSKIDQEDFFVVYYSIGNSEWQELSKINKSNWQNSIFQLPISEINDSLKIKIESLIDVKKSFFLKLYNPSLEIQYDNCENSEINELNKKRQEIIDFITKNNDGDESWLSQPNSQLLIDKMIQLVDSNLIKTNYPLAFKGNKIFWITDDLATVYCWEIDRDNLFSLPLKNYENNYFFNFEEGGKTWQSFFNLYEKKIKFNLK